MFGRESGYFYRLSLSLLSELERLVFFVSNTGDKVVFKTINHDFRA